MSDCDVPDASRPPVLMHLTTMMMHSLTLSFASTSLPFSRSRNDLRVYPPRQEREEDDEGEETFWTEIKSVFGLRAIAGGRGERGGHGEHGDGDEQLHRSARLRLLQLHQKGKKTTWKLRSSFILRARCPAMS